MSLKITNLNTYMRLSIDSFVDEQIFSEMYKYYHKPDKPDFSQPNLAALLSTKISSLITLIINSTLTLEAYANLLGNCVLSKGFHEKYLRNLPILDKIAAILEIKYGEKIDRGSEPFQTFGLLIKERNKLVHDKGKDSKNINDIRVEMDKKNIKIDIRKLLNEFLNFDKYLKNINCEVEFLFGLNKDSIEAWLGNRDNFLKASEGLLYANSYFPNLYEYSYVVRRHTGFSPDNCKTKKKKIIQISTILNF